MKFRVEATGFKMSPSLKNFAKEKLGDLDVYFADIQEVEVTLDMEVKGQKEVVNCILNIRVPGKDAYIKSTSSIFEDAILKAADSAKRKLRKRKTQLQTARKKSSPNRIVSAKKALKKKKKD
ncbi:MAG TPA: HPF/RaiA family ribosome-associated protein [Niabella sp.]|jgi:ribosomal subunit interface protein|nr:HPF/RaiA family ribosome-associated protein [Chitinophagaceae bacterium]HUN03191.1 HPF/RaiA family ribosome-associated protein [Niabella sp.]